MAPDALRRIREGMHWTQTQAAVKAGVCMNTWARWERGEVQPHPLRERDLQRLLRHAEKRAAKRAALLERLARGRALLAGERTGA